MALGALARGGADRPGSAEAEYAALLGRMYAAFAEATDSRVVVDGSKQPADAYLAAKSGADVYIVHLVRDPRGVAYSLTRRTAKPDGTHPRQTVKAALLWIGRNLAATAIRNAVPRDHLMVLNYEELMADPEAALRRIVSFVGESAEPVAITNGQVQLPTAHTATNRGRSVAERSVLEPDRAWTTKLGDGDYRIATAMTAPMRWRFGYRARRA